jgi:predicted phosphoribosyltransferase
MGILVQDKALRGLTGVFLNRQEAGRLLAKALGPLRDTPAVVFAIPAGGVPVGLEVARALRAPLEPLVVRKLQVPWNPEAGFGALGPDGKAVFNEALLARLGLSQEEIKGQMQRTLQSIRHREALLRAGRAYPMLRGSVAVVVDDGLASGYTMLAGLRFLKGRGPEQVVVAVPTGSEAAVRMLLQEVDALYCLNVRPGPAFAVADAYRHWHDLSEQEVLRLLEKTDASWED